MIIYFVYFIIASILLFVIYLTKKAIIRGLIAKNKKKNLKKNFNKLTK